MATMWKTKKTSILIVLTVTLLSACSSNKLEWLDTTLWKKDYRGCVGYRAQLIPQIIKSTTQLAGKDDLYFFKVIGKPNRVSYGDRSRKTFVYYLSPGKDCDKTSQADALFIEFNATGTAQLLYIKKLVD
jgi:hypothetical protein